MRSSRKSLSMLERVNMLVRIDWNYKSNQQSIMHFKCLHYDSYYFETPTNSGASSSGNTSGVSLKLHTYA